VAGEESEGAVRRSTVKRLSVGDRVALHDMSASGTVISVRKNGITICWDDQRFIKKIPIDIDVARIILKEPKQ
jgi:hypothetical protein